MKAVYSYNGDLQGNLMEISTDIRYGENKYLYCYRKLYKHANI